MPPCASALRMLLLAGVHCFQFLQDLLRRRNPAGRRRRHAPAAGDASTRRFVGGAIAGLRLWERLGRRGLDVVHWRRWLRRAGPCACKNQLLRCAVAGSPYHQEIEIESRKQIRENGIRFAGSVGAEDAMAPGRALHLHAGLRGDGLQNLQQLRVACLDLELAVMESHGRRRRGLAGKRDRSLRNGCRCWLLRNRCRRLGCLRGAYRHSADRAGRNQARRGQDAPQMPPRGCRYRARC